MPNAILTSKIHIPPVRSDLVRRQRLLGRLDQGLFDATGHVFTRRLTSITAPAGFGKTTLASQWVASHEHNAWISLDGGDDDLHRFLSYLAAALSAIEGTGQSLAGLLETPQTLPATSLASALLQDAAIALTPFILVLDDYHLLADPAISEAMTFVLDHLPPVMHLVITSRAQPELPLSRLRARGQLLEIGPAELRFTTREATAFMNEAMGLALSAGDVSALENRTEGWAAGLQLAGLALQPYSSSDLPGSASQSQVEKYITSFSGDDRYISDYLVEEVLSHQPAEITRFLLDTAVPERICGDLADALTGDKDGQEQLEWLQRKNLFIVPLDRRRQWYRYHALLADYLRQQLAKSDPDRLKSLHRRAGRWFARRAETGEAVAHFLAAGDLDQAAVLVEEVARPMAMRGEVPTLVRWLRAFPVDYLLDRPGLVTIEVILEVITSSLMEKRLINEANLVQAIEKVEKDEPSGPRREQLLAELTAHRAGLAMLNLDYERSLAISYQAREYATGNDFVLSYIFLVNATTYRLTGQDSMALAALLRATAHSERTNSTLLSVTCLVNLAELYEVTGQLTLAEVTCQRALDKARDSNGRPLPSAGQAFLGLAKVNRERNQLEQAFENLTEALRLAELSGMSGLKTDSLITRALLEKAQGKWPAAYDTLDQAAELSTKAADPFTIRRVGAFRARLFLIQGDKVQARLWADLTGISPKDPVNDYLEIDYLTLARILLVEGQPRETLSLLDRWQPAAEKAGRRSRLVEYYFLRAFVARDMSDDAEASHQLVKALEEAQPEGFVRIFADEGQAMADLLSWALEQPAVVASLKPHVKSYARNIFDIITQEFGSKDAGLPGELPADQHQTERLKERELQVLRLIAAGLSNREIGAELFLTEGTVKSYTHQLYSKLGVHRRTEAVERGRELGLIP